MRVRLSLEGGEDRRHNTLNLFIAILEWWLLMVEEKNEASEKESLHHRAERHAIHTIIDAVFGLSLGLGAFSLTELPLGDLHRKMLMISSMHFMDPYNFDLERVQRCCIHYAVPDGRIIPFCTMNSIHRPEVEKQLGIPLDQWRMEHKVEVGAVM